LIDRSLRSSYQFLRKSAMRAVVINEYGPSEKLTLVDLKEPSPRPDEVLIRVRAAGVNPVDWKIRGGMLKIVLWLKFPFVPGFDISGDVAAVGSRVTRFKPGDPVYAMLGPPRGGGYAELAVAPESAVARKAHSQRYIEAASMPIAALTALQGLRDLGRLKPGQSVLINGASGGVGTFAVQIARALGARVTGVCGPKNVGLVRSLGAEMVLDYTKEDFTAPGKTYDVILDAVAKSSFANCRKVLAPAGTYVTTLPSVDVLIQGMVLLPLLSLVGQCQRALTLFAKARREDLEYLARLADEGKLKPVIDRVYPLDQARAAHDQSESERTRGKLVLEIG
jgi:NADPH:quinone reductase-like Zn-dependent oxidoreductase